MKHGLTSVDGRLNCDSSEIWNLSFHFFNIVFTTADVVKWMQRKIAGYIYVLYSTLQLADIN